MKVIDLYLAIERNKNIPKKVVYKYKTYMYKPEYKQYYREEYGDMISLFLEATMDDKVYLIEDTPKEDRCINVCGSLFTKSEYDELAKSKEDKKIEKLDISGLSSAEAIIKNTRKLNEIIDRLNGDSDENN